MLIPKLANTIAKIDLDSPFINQDIVHSLICHDALIFSFKLNKSELQRIACFPVPDHLAADHFAEARENNLQVVRLGHRVQLADEKHIIRRLDIGFRQIIKHGKYLLSALSFGFRLFLFQLALRLTLRQLFQLDVILKVHNLFFHIIIALSCISDFLE